LSASAIQREVDTNAPLVFAHVIQTDGVVVIPDNRSGGDVILGDLDAYRVRPGAVLALGEKAVIEGDSKYYINVDIGGLVVGPDPKKKVKGERLSYAKLVDGVYKLPEEEGPLGTAVFGSINIEKTATGGNASIGKSVASGVSAAVGASEAPVVIIPTALPTSGPLYVIGNLTVNTTLSLPGLTVSGFTNVGSESGSALLTVTGAATFLNAATFSGTTTFTSAATFYEAAEFIKETTTFRGDTTFRGAATASGKVVFDGDAKVIQSSGSLTPTTGGSIKDNTAGAAGNQFNSGAKTVTVSESITVSAKNPLTIPAGKTLTVAAGATVTVAEGAAIEVAEYATLTVADGAKLDVKADAKLTVAEDAKLDVTGTLDVASGATVEVAEGATLKVTGDLDVAADANVEVTGVLFLDGSTNTGGKADNGSLAGTITIKAGGKTYSTGTFAGTGHTVIEAGGEAYAGQTPEDATHATIGGESATLNLTSGSFALNATGYVLTGNATVNQTFGIDGIQLVIAANTKLTVDLKRNDPDNNYPGFWLMRGGYITGTDETSVIEVKTPSVGNSIIPSGRGLLYVSQTNTAGANFYGSSGSTLGDASSANVNVPAGTYTWTTLSAGVAGWKAGS
jgi:hypothetical protein